MKFCDIIIKELNTLNRKLLEKPISVIKNNEKLPFEQQKVVTNELTNLADQYEQNCKDKANLLLEIDFDKINNGLEKFAEQK